MLCFRIIPVAKNLIDKRGKKKGLLKFSVESFSRSAENFRGESFSVSFNSSTEIVHG